MSLPRLAESEVQRLAKPIPTRQRPCETELLIDEEQLRRLDRTISKFWMTSDLTAETKNDVGSEHPIRKSCFRFE
jgi:hypothetical protein